MMKGNYLSGKSLTLRAVEPEDLDLLYTLENDPDTWDVSNFNVPYSRYVLKQYIENSQCDMFADRQLRLMIVLRESATVVGTIDITDFAPLHARGEVGISIRREFQGKGYAREALELLCDYALGFLHMKQLVAHVAVDNEASIRLFSSCGFVKCGLLKEWWHVRDGYLDVLILQRLQASR